MEHPQDKKQFLQNLKEQFETELWRITAWYESDLEALRAWIALFEEMIELEE